MNGGALQPTPRWGAVFREQLMAVGMGVRREMAVGAAIVLAITVLLMVSITRAGEGSVSMSPDGAGPILALLGLLAPLAVWKGEGPSSRGYFWSLPVAREPHTLMKVFCGWLWLMIALAVFAAIVSLQSWITGGGPGVNEIRVVFVHGMPPGTRVNDTIDPSLIAQVHWTTPAWHWLVLFITPTITYAVGSIAALTADHPWRLLLLPFLAFGVLSVVADTGDVRWLAQVSEQVMAGHYSLETLLTGSNETAIPLTLPDGERVLVWRYLAEPGKYFTTAAIWGIPALLGLLFAAFCYQER
jgi:hypothetical protein